MRSFFIILMLAWAWTHSAHGAGERPLVLATTTILADVVRMVAGDTVEVRSLLPMDCDPHAYEATPRDANLVAQARLVFANGLGLESFLNPLLENAAAEQRLVLVNREEDALPLDDGAAHEHGPACAGPHVDPHAWFDPLRVGAWGRRIAGSLARLAPHDADAMQQRAAAWAGQAANLHAWIQQEVSSIPPERRKLVTDHNSFNYFARQYGFEVVGALIPSFSTLAEPSARQMAELESAIARTGARAIFVGNLGHHALADRVARDTGLPVVALDTCSLSDRSPDYLSFMSNNVRRIVEALR